MKNTQFEVGDVFGDNIGKEDVSLGQITKLNLFSAKRMKTKN